MFVFARTAIRGTRGKIAPRNGEVRLGELESQSFETRIGVFRNPKADGRHCDCHVERDKH